MNFLSWHYTKGVDLYIKKWLFFVRWINHYFSPLLLLSSLFDPWKRLVEVDNRPGFDIARFFETLSFNAISRTIGFVARLFFFVVGLASILLAFVGGGFGMVFWMAIPPLGLPDYLRIKREPKNSVKAVWGEMNGNMGRAVEVFLNSPQGQFLVAHLGITKETLLAKAEVSHLPDKHNYSSTKELVEDLLEINVWSEGALRSINLTKEDVVSTALWWDNKMAAESGSDEKDYFGRPGVALNLLYGYTPTLDRYSVDMAAPQEYSHRLIGREGIVGRMERVLTAGNSVIIVGQPGVGKKTVVLEFARRAATGQLGENMSYKRVLEFDYNALLSSDKDLNAKKNLLSQALAEATAAGNVILVVRDIHRLTSSDIDGFDFTDVIEEHLERKSLKMIAISADDDYEKYVVPNLRIRKYLKEVVVDPTSSEQAFEIMLEHAMTWEYTRNITILVPTLRKIISASDKYITETPFPEKALELLDAVVEYCLQSNIVVVGENELNIVLEEKTGVPFANITQGEKNLLGNLEDVIHEKLINQDAAVSLIAKSLRGRSVGVKKDTKPVGSFLFLGPTGVGKTETAKVLARVYFGSEEHIIRFDMAEYSGSQGLEMLIGSVDSKQPGRLTTAIKNKPASLLLLDEIEKSSPQILNLFLSLLDEGKITDAFGKVINCKNLFVIATSNAGAEFIRQLVTQGVTGSELQQQVVDKVMSSGHFSPEFLNRFDGVVVYSPLTKENLKQIAKLLFDGLVDKLKLQNIELTIDDGAVDKLAEEGYEPEFGARPMRRIIDLAIGDVLGKVILSGELLPGGSASLVAGNEKDEYIVNINSSTGT